MDLPMDSSCNSEGPYATRERDEKSSRLRSMTPNRDIGTPWLCSKGGGTAK